MWGSFPRRHASELNMQTVPSLNITYTEEKGAPPFMVRKQMPSILTSSRVELRHMGFVLVTCQDVA